MSVATPTKEAKRKRKSPETVTQLLDAKRLKSEQPTPGSNIEAKNAPAVRQPFSNSSLTKEIGKQMALTMTEKPFPNPKNQSQNNTNQAWRKQNLFRKRVARTEAKKKQSGRSAIGEGAETEDTKQGGEKTAMREDGVKKKVKKEKKPKVDKRMKETEEVTGTEDQITDAVVNQQEEVPQTPAKSLNEEAVKKEEKPKVNQRSKEAKKDVVNEVEITATSVKQEEKFLKKATKPMSLKKAKKDKRSRKIKSEEQDNEEENIDLLPQELIAERTVANRGNWAASKPVGGRFINHDPVFSTDEK